MPWNADAGRNGETRHSDQPGHIGARTHKNETPVLRHFHISLRLAHWFVNLLFGVVLAVVALTILLAWRLAQGPVDVSFLSERIEAAWNAGDAPNQIEIGGIALAWEGFHQGLDRPLDLQLRDIVVRDRTGRKRLEVPKAAVSLAMANLLFGQIAPRAVELDGVRLTATRSASNMFSLDIGEPADNAAPSPDAPDLPAVLAELMRAPGFDWPNGGNPLHQMRRVRLRELEIRVVDQVAGVIWTASHTEADLIRRGNGGIIFAASADLAVKDQRTTLTLAAATAPDRSSTQVRFSLGPVVPAALGLPALAPVDAPVSVTGSATLGPTFAPSGGSATIRLGAGKLRVGAGIMPVARAFLAVRIAQDALTISAASLVLPGLEGRPDTTLSASGTVDLSRTRIATSLELGLDRVAFVDLPRLWPAGTGGGARPWLAENVTDGTAHDVHIELALEADRDFGNLSLTKVTGTIEGDDATVHWLRPIPPIEQAHARVRIVDPDTIDVTVLGGRQRIGTRTPIAITGGLLHMTGMEKKDQIAEITMQVAGPFADTIALLREPRLGLLARHPIDLREPGGDASVALKVKFPLENKVTMDDVGLGVTAHLRQGHLSNVAGGRDLDGAELDIVASKEQLTLKGNGQIAGIASTIDGTMNFLAGGPRDIVQRITVTGKASVRQLVAAGLDIGDVVTGEALLNAVWSQPRAGGGDIAVDADLTGAGIAIQPLGWQKAPGVPLKATAKLVLAGDRLSGIETIAADGTGITVRAAAEMAGGRVSAIRLDRLTLGRNDINGTVRLPQGGPIGIKIGGAGLDLAAKLTAKTPPRDPSKPEPTGPAWTLIGHFGHVLLAHEVVALNVDADVTSDGRVMTALRLVGATQPSGRFSAQIVRQGGARRLSVSAADAGAFLRGLDIVHTMQGGTMTLSGAYDDSNAAHALNGTAEILDFRIRNAPVLGRLLQAMTLYGLVDVVQGPGLAFAKLTAPLILSDTDLELRDARAFSPSLGMTTKGHIDLRAEAVDLQGTVVPAYFFNSMLGRLPVFGGLFKNEEGGGVFAANYAIKGPLSDPTVSVNPLSILTPGFLRKMFGNF